MGHKAHQKKFGFPKCCSDSYSVPLRRSHLFILFVSVAVKGSAAEKWTLPWRVLLPMTFPLLQLVLPLEGGR